MFLSTMFWIIWIVGFIVINAIIGIIAYIVSDAERMKQAKRTYTMIDILAQMSSTSSGTPTPENTKVLKSAVLTWNGLEKWKNVTPFMLGNTKIETVQDVIGEVLGSDALLKDKSPVLYLNIGGANIYCATTRISLSKAAQVTGPELDRLCEKIPALFPGNKEE